MLSLKNGRPGFDQVTGENAWVHLQSNRQTYTIFNEAMRDLSASISPAVAASFDWSRFPVIADIGGGIGSQLTSIFDARILPAGAFFSINPRSSQSHRTTAELSVSAATSSKRSQSRPTPM
jgi:hypothetical protein